MADPASIAAISGTLELVNKSVDLVRNLRKKGDDELNAAEMRNTLIDLLDDLVEVKSEFVSLKAVLLSKEEEINLLKPNLMGKINFSLTANYIGWKGIKPHIALNATRKTHWYSI